MYLMMKFLREKWDAENKALKASAQVEESAYKYGTPPSNFAVTDPTGQVHYFPSKQAADGFKREIGQ